MSSFLLHISTAKSPLSFPSLSSSFKPLKSHKFSIRACSGTPARDRIIDFGKYKGRMLGSLPSTYLKWISSNLRARDFEDWAKLADQVLDDAVYQDRIEWEFAQKILNGDVLTSPLSTSSSGASSLIEISERFGWDNDDKLGWSKLNFELLGTSNGGRIPRIKEKGARICKEEEDESESESESESDVEVGERREVRRERLKLKRIVRSNASQRLLRVGIQSVETKKKDSELKDGQVYSRFPGRESLLRKAMDAKGKRPPF